MVEAGRIKDDALRAISCSGGDQPILRACLRIIRLEFCQPSDVCQEFQASSVSVCSQNIISIKLYANFAMYFERFRTVLDHDHRSLKFINDHDTYLWHRRRVVCLASAAVASFYLQCLFIILPPDPSEWGDKETEAILEVNDSIKKMTQAIIAISEPQPP
jgi:hypothetical protein